MLITRLPRAVSMALVPIMRTCVSDASGRLRPLYPFRKRWRTAGDRADLPDTVLARIASRIGIAPRQRAVLLATALPICLFIVFAAVAPGMLGLSVRILIPVIVVAFLLLLAQLAAVRPAPVERERIVLAMLGEGRCPSCAYPLLTKTSRDDRLATCSECGAVWWRQV